MLMIAEIENTLCLQTPRVGACFFALAKGKIAKIWVGLRSRWGGNGPMLFLKSIGVGLDRFGAIGGGSGASFGGFFFSFLDIFGHFWPLRLKCVRPKNPM